MKQQIIAWLTAISLSLGLLFMFLAETIPAQTVDTNTIIVVVKEDGEEKKFTETIWSLEDFWAKYDKYQLLDMNDERVLFTTQN